MDVLNATEPALQNHPITPRGQADEVIEHLHRCALHMAGLGDLSAALDLGEEARALEGREAESTSARSAAWHTPPALPLRWRGGVTSYDCEPEFGLWQSADGQWFLGGTPKRWAVVGQQHRRAYHIRPISSAIARCIRRSHVGLGACAHLRSRGYCFELITRGDQQWVHSLNVGSPDDGGALWVSGGDSPRRDWQRTLASVRATR
jgi:hypothetical protein